MNANKLEVVPTIEQFGAWFMADVTEGSARWVSAAAHARRAIAAYPEFPQWVVDHNPGVNEEFIYRFAGIGVKYMAELCVMECPGAKKLRQLPLSTQEQCMATGVEILVDSKKGYEPLTVSVQNLTPAQAAQVFSKDRVRTPAEQRLWIEDRREQARQKASATVAETGLPYRVTKTHFEVFGRHSFTHAEVKALLRDAK